jgi:hypothetical protein
LTSPVESTSKRVDVGVLVCKPEEIGPDIEWVLASNRPSLVNILTDPRSATLI